MHNSVSKDRFMQRNRGGSRTYQEDSHTFKKTSINAKIPDGVSFVQETKTPFETVHDVVKRFLKDGRHVRLVTEHKDMEATKKESEYIYLLHDIGNRRWGSSICSS